MPIRIANPLPASLARPKAVQPLPLRPIDKKPEGYVWSLWVRPINARAARNHGSQCVAISEPSPCPPNWLRATAAALAREPHTIATAKERARIAIKSRGEDEARGLISGGTPRRDRSTLSLMPGR